MIQAATAPVIIGLFYIYIRDKYEKEPWQMLLWGLLFGVYATFVIYGVGQWVEAMFPLTDLPFAAAFLQAALVEESVKLLFLLALLARNPQYNEPFDAIVYAVFISLGFAWIENIVYVTHPLWGGIGTALARAVISSPGHGLYAVQMGYWLSEAKFAGRKVGWLLAFLVPYLYHGWYNYLLLADIPAAEIFLALLMGLLIITGLRHMAELLKKSPFRPTGEKLSQKQ